jgi:hypothetical protein
VGVDLRNERPSAADDRSSSRHRQRLTLFAVALAILLFRGLLRPEVRAYLDRP